MAKIHEILFVYLAIILMMVTGCASYQAAAIPAGQVSNYARNSKNGGISFAAEPYDTAEQAKSAFYADVTSQSYFPVHIVVKNDSSENIMVLRDTAELQTAGNTYHSTRSSNMFNDFEHNKMAYALLGFGIFSYMSAEDANRKMESDWREKEMPEQLIVQPGRTGHGFVYFKLPPGVTVRGSELKMDATSMANGKTIKLALGL
jgi:hypothetical protein